MLNYWNYISYNIIVLTLIVIYEQFTYILLQIIYMYIIYVCKCLIEIAIEMF